MTMDTEKTDLKTEMVDFLRSKLKDRQDLFAERDQVNEAIRTLQDAAQTMAENSATLQDEIKQLESDALLIMSRGQTPETFSKIRKIREQIAESAHWQSEIIEKIIPLETRRSDIQKYKALYITASSGSIMEFYRQLKDALDIYLSSNSKAVMVKNIKKEIVNLVLEKNRRWFSSSMRLP